MRILSEDEFEAFAAAERKIYGPASNSGCYAWSDVRDRSDSEALACLWDDAMSTCEMIYPDPDPDLLKAEVARRVAVSQYFALLGELPKNAGSPPDPEDMRATQYVKVPIPHRMSQDEVKLDPAAQHSNTTYEIKRFADEIHTYRDNDIRRIFQSVAVLITTDNLINVGEALHTAVIWERG